MVHRFDEPPPSLLSFSRMIANPQVDCPVGDNYPRNKKIKIKLSLIMRVVQVRKDVSVILRYPIIINMVSDIDSRSVTRTKVSTNY